MYGFSLTDRNNLWVELFNHIVQDPSELGPEPPPDGAIFWGVPEEVLTDPRLVVLKVGVPENCPGPEPRGWLDGLKRRKWYEKAQAPEIRPVMGFYMFFLVVWFILKPWIIIHLKFKFLKLYFNLILKLYLKTLDYT